MLSVNHVQKLNVFGHDLKERHHEMKMSITRCAVFFNNHDSNEISSKMDNFTKMTVHKHYVLPKCKSDTVALIQRVLPSNL